MRIITWNINSVRLRIAQLERVANELRPDIIALQETKASDSDFPLLACKALGYDYISFSGEKSYNGVAILSKIPFNDQFCLNLYNQDKRHIAIRINDLEIHNFYVPAGGDIPDPELNSKFKHKLEFLEQMNKWFLENRKTSDKLVLVGDLNIAPYEHDVWSSRQLRHVVSHTDIERKTMLKLIDQFGWVDCARQFVPFDQKLYSWWSYRNLNWQQSNRGRRLDHIWVSESLSLSCTAFQIAGETRAWQQPSDHVPVILDLDYPLKAEVEVLQNKK